MKINKKVLFISLFMMAIGMATIATTIFINSGIKISSLDSDFQIYFSSAILDGVDKSNILITDDKQHLEFETKELKKINDSSVLEFEVTNNSTQYDAHVEISCVLNDDKYITITKDRDSYDIPAQTRESGILTVTLKELTTEALDQEIICSLETNAVERDSQLDPIIVDPTYQITGTLQDEDGIPLEGKQLVVFSETPHYVTTDNFGFFYVSGLEKGQHEIYYLEDNQEIENLGKNEIKSLATDNAVITTSDTEIEFDDIELEDFVVEPDKSGEVELKFDANGGTVESEEEKVPLYSKVKDIQKPHKENSTFKYWTYKGKEVNENTIINEPKDLKAMWKYSIRFEGNNYTFSPASGNQIDDLELGDIRDVVITPNSGYYFQNISCTNGYTNNLSTGLGTTEEQTVTIKNNNNSNNTICTISMGEVCPYSVGQSWTYTSATNFTVPCNGTYTLKAYGAKGGDSSNIKIKDRSGSGTEKQSGVNGGSASGSISLNKNSVLNVVTYAGGSGVSVNKSSSCKVNSTTYTLSISGNTAAGGTGYGIQYNGSTILAAGGGAGGGTNHGISSDGCTDIPLSNGNVGPKTSYGGSNSSTTGGSGGTTSKTIASRSVYFGYGGSGGGYNGGAASGGNNYSGGCYCSGLSGCSTSYGSSASGKVVITLSAING